MGQKTKPLNAKKLRDSLGTLVKGLTNEPPAGLSALGVQGKTWAMTDLIAKLNVYFGLLDAQVKAETAVAQAQTAIGQVEQEMVSFIQQTRRSIKGALGNQNPSLTDYGLTPDKEPAPLTVEAEQAKVAKMRATRALRHTMGPKQKAALKGQAPEPPAPPPQPQPTPAPKPGP